jgi:hypothetical protein
MPSSSQITVIGSGIAKSCISSAWPWGTISSSRLCTISATRGRSASIRRGANACDTIRRSRVCSGGSELSMFLFRPSEFGPKSRR